MKIKLFCDSGANGYSTREETLDTQDLGFEDGEWEELTDDEKYKVAAEWANECLEIGYEEL